MKPSEAVKPISHIKAHASEVLRDIAENRKTVIVTQNGEARAVIQDLRSYEEMIESIALLKIVALSEKAVRAGRVRAVDEAFRRVHARIQRRARR